MWSEHIRRQYSWYEKSYFAELVKDFDEACKTETELSNGIHIAAKLIMWVLTTTIRKLRDEATRALYFYGRRYPQKLLKLLEYSLEIDDPYVSERMLAAAYGIAMARQNDYNDFAYRDTWLPKYGRFLYDSFFDEKAKYPTTHILARDYAKRTIDISLLHYPDLLNKEEQKRINYLLENFSHKEWGRSQDKDRDKYRDGNAPIQMDFENYTIGGLVRGRQNYDMNHEEYKKVLSQIYWRIYGLGYSLEKFGQVDKQIVSAQRDYFYRQGNVGKIDRYGKKYSWIAFYEMAGYRSDLGLLKDWDNDDEIRISDVDIDPSFPVELKEYDLVGTDNFLGDDNKPAEAWYETDTDLVTKKFLETEEFFDQNAQSNWYLLQARISQQNSNETRDAHIAINALIVDDDEYQKLNQVVQKYSDYQFEYIRSMEHHYIYAGEMPWSDLMPDDVSVSLSILYNHRSIEKDKKEIRILNRGKELSDKEYMLLREKKDSLGFQEMPDGTMRLRIFNNDEEKTEQAAVELEYDVTYVNVRKEEEQVDTLDLSAELATVESSWESYHSEIIPSGELVTPSLDISNHLEIFLEPQTSDLYNKDGDLIVTNFKYGEGFGNTTWFTYIRKDKLDEYLEITGKKIVWFQWAEKRYFPKGIKNLNFTRDEDKQEYRNYYKIFL